MCTSKDHLSLLGRYRMIISQAWLLLTHRTPCLRSETDSSLSRREPPNLRISTTTRMRTKDIRSYIYLNRSAIADNGSATVKKGRYIRSALHVPEELTNDKTWTQTHLYKRTLQRQCIHNIATWGNLRSFCVVVLKNIMSAMMYAFTVY